MSEASNTGSHGPLHQFEIQSLIDLPLIGVNKNIDISFTNSSLLMVVAVIAITVFLAGGMRRGALVPSRWQSIAELSYEFVAGTLKDIVEASGRKYFPFVFSLFMFILFCNLLGMFPYSFTVTSHIAVTFALAAVIFVGVTAIGFIKHGFRYFKLFLPAGVPVLLAPVFIPIEIFSYFTRPVSLSIRLAANMMAGHVLLKVIAGFIVAMGIAGVLPLLFTVILVGFEVFVAILQAYIFMVLTCVYLNDAIHLH